MWHLSFKAERDMIITEDNENVTLKQVLKILSVSAKPTFFNCKSTAKNFKIFLAAVLENESLLYDTTRIKNPAHKK